MFGTVSRLAAARRASQRVSVLARPRASPASRLRATTTSAPEKTETAADAAASIEFLRCRSAAVGLRLSHSELASIVAEAAPRDGRLAADAWRASVGRRGLLESERLTLSEYLNRSHDVHVGQHLLRRTAKCGVAFFAATGAHAAGAAGCHVVGAVLVGGVTALGGGTLNNVVAGNAPVGWARDPTFLYVALAAAAAGFYLWPLAEGSVAPETGAAARYAGETAALGALAVVGAQQGIVAGFAPAVSATLGVTIAFGGVARDAILGRELALGSTSGCQSYGVAAAAGAAVYVALRELHVWNCAGSTARLLHGGIPLSARILAGFSTVCAVRAYAWHTKDDKLLLSMADNAKANRAAVRTLLGARDDA